MDHSESRTCSNRPSPSINLLRGWPNHGLLPIEAIKSAANAALSNPQIAYPGLEYGPDPGYGPALEEIAAWLTQFYSPLRPIAAKRLNITGGASQNLACLLSVYTDSEYTRNIWLVSPSYFMVFRIFEDAGFATKMCAVPEDEQGLDVEYLETALRQSEDAAVAAGNNFPKHKPLRKRAKVYKHVIYCVPTFANPSGQTMSLQRREALIRLARQYDALVVSDDVYDRLQWPIDNCQVYSNRALLPRLVDIDRQIEGGTQRSGADGFGNAISNMSFSKITGPGMRTGVAEGTEKFVYGLSQNGATASGGAPSQLTSTYVAEMLRSGDLQEHIVAVLQPAYQSRYILMMAAIEKHLLPLGFAVPYPRRMTAGGYFIWLTLPPGIDAAALTACCLETSNLIIAPGNLFRVPDEDVSDDLNRHIRLCFSWEDECNLAEGVRRLSMATRHLLLT